MNKALFLDRDGVINIHDGYVYRINEFKFIEDIFKLCLYFQEKKYKIFVITNQAGIAKKIFTMKDLDILNNHMIQEFKKRRIMIEKIYFCPHHPDHDLNCNSRKPKPGMILKASEDYDIDLSKSVLIGDQITDIQAGIAAGIRRNYLFNTCKKISKSKINFKQTQSLLEIIELEK